MPYPQLPVPERDEVLLISTCYEDGGTEWDEALRALAGRWDEEVVAVENCRARLRPVENAQWDSLHGGNLPGLLPEGSPAPPVVAVVDIPVVYGGGDVLLVDLRDIPGRGVRVPSDGIGPVLENLMSGSLRFDELVRGMDRLGVYQGDGGVGVTTPTTVLRTSFPRLPVSDSTLLVRTDFGDDRSWRGITDSLGEPDEGDRLPTGDAFYEKWGLGALVVDDREFAHLQPGQVPALVRPDGHTTMVALADATTMEDPAHPLFVVDLYDTPGQAARVPLAEVGSMAINLEIANTEFASFV